MVNQSLGVSVREYQTDVGPADYLYMKVQRIWQGLLTIKTLNLAHGYLLFSPTKDSLGMLEEETTLKVQLQDISDLDIEGLRPAQIKAIKI